MMGLIRTLWETILVLLEFGAIICIITIILGFIFSVFKR